MVIDKSNNRFSIRIFLKFAIPLRLLILLVSVIFWQSSQAQPSEKIVIGQIEVEPGSKTSGNLIVEANFDQGTFIPITIIHGSIQGPVLTLIAGNHGTEYVPIITLQSLASKIDPLSLAGTVILVHIANVPAFKERSVYRSPVDNKNINRFYPGKYNGTLSERIAFTITDKIIDRSDYLIDLHGGEFNEDFVDFAFIYYDCPDNYICEQTRTMATAFGFNYIHISPFNLVPDSIEYTYCDMTALRRGVVAITVELGGRGRVDNEIVGFAERGLINVMRELEMLKGEKITNEHPIYLTDETFIRSNYDGIFYSLVHSHQSISKGALLGFTTDYFGNRIEEYYSPISGIVLKNTVSPTINKGESIFWLAKTVADFLPKQTY